METSERSKEQSVIQRISSNGFQSSCEVTEIANDFLMSIDDTAVKSLKILAQICVDELNKCNELEKLQNETPMENGESIYVSSDSESDTSSTRSTQIGAITGGTDRQSCSDSFSENDSSSDSSSTESDDSDDETVENKDKLNSTLEQPENDTKIHEDDLNQSKNEENNENDKNCSLETELYETIAPIDEQPSMIMIDHFVHDEVFNPISLRDMCKDVLQAHCMIRYDVPTLKLLCEHTLASAGLDVPIIYVVQEEGQYLCLDSEFDETELASLFNGAGNGVCESVEICPNEGDVQDSSVADNASLIDQCVALENILSSPSPEENQIKIHTEITSDDATYMMDDNIYEMNDGFHDTIQYEETVLPSETCSMGKSKSFKKYLQKKYVQTSNLHKMFVINKLLRKYKIHQVSVFEKKPTVQQRLRKIILKMRQKAKQQLKPKKPATRRSARIAHKIKQQQNDDPDSQRSEKQAKLVKVNKATKHESKSETRENRELCKIINMSNLIQNSGNKKNLTDTDKQSIERDILKLIAKKRTLKRKLSICHRPAFNFDDDGYCYDEDGQISEMVSSFINNTIDGECRSSNAKKSRPRKTPLENKTINNKESESEKSEKNEKKKNPLKISQKKQTKVESKVKNTKSKEKNMKKKISEIKTNSELSSVAPSIENKTMKKSTFFDPISTSTPKVSTSTPKVSTSTPKVKEVIPAKRTRFLSIDGSLLRYGTEAKKSYNQMKSFKDKLDLEESSPKRKVPSQKNSKKIPDSPLIKEIPARNNTNNVKQIKENRDTSSTVSNLKPIEKAMPSELTKQPKDVSDRMKIPIRRLSVKDYNGRMKEMQASKDAMPMKNSDFSEKLSKSPNKNTDESNAIQKMAHVTDKHHKSTENDNTSYDVKEFKNQSVEKTFDKTSMKTSITKKEIPLSERSFCSTMVSPLKIIIEPKRIAAIPTDEKTICSQGKLAATNDVQVNSKIGDKSPTIQSSEGKRVGRQTRFSERIQPNNNQNESFVTFKTVNEDPRLKSPAERARASALQFIQNMPTKLDTDASIEPYLDIEKYLPSTTIVQPKPAKRCSRAQTISLAESPMRAITFEPMQLRSSNNLWNHRKLSQTSNESSTHQLNRMPFKPMESQYTMHRHKQSQNTSENWSKLNQYVPAQNISNYNNNNHNSQPSQRNSQFQNTLIKNIPSYKPTIHGLAQNSPIQNTWIQNSPVHSSSNHSSPIQRSPIQHSPIQNSPIRNASIQNAMVPNKTILKTTFENSPNLRTALQKASIQNIPTQTKQIQKAPIKRPAIDMSSFPDPESLKIPLDLRSPSSSRSPLSLPIVMPLAENIEKSPCMYLHFII